VDRACQETLFSSESSEWGTPNSFYVFLDKRFNFTLDPCAAEDNHKCEKYFTTEDNGLTKSWKGHNVFVNPPYGKGIADWLKKAYEESQQTDTVVVCLIPSRTDTKYWHDYCMRANEIYFVKGRLKFGESSNSAPFPSAVVVFSGSTSTFMMGPGIPTREKPFPTRIGAFPRK
jgi:site-specific DNA-methyltransferase (adenine-specific)